MTVQYRCGHRETHNLATRKSNQVLCQGCINALVRTAELEHGERPLAYAAAGDLDSLVSTLEVPHCGPYTCNR